MIKKIIVIIFLSFVSNKMIAQDAAIDTVFYGDIGGKRIFTNYYSFTKDSIIKEKKYVDVTKRIEKTTHINSVEGWNNLLDKIDITLFSKIKNGKSRTESCGSDTYITLKLKNGKNVSVINAEDDEMWIEIQKELERLKNKIQ